MRVFVTPFVGVWIEITVRKHGRRTSVVTPFVGVWIEINSALVGIIFVSVTPFVGVWIEMEEEEIFFCETESLPSWECGLKFLDLAKKMNLSSHSLRGSVD